MNIEILSLDSDLNPWDTFVHSTTAGTVYHGSAWLTCLASGMGQRIQIHTVMDHGHILGGAVVCYAAKFGFRIARKPWATAYTGPLFSDAASDTAKSFLLVHLRKHFNHIRLVSSPHAHLSPTTPAVWKANESVTGIVEISNLDATWNSFDRRARQRIRKAESLGIVSTEVSSGHDFYGLYTLTYSRQGLPMPLSEEEIVTTLELAYQRGILRFFSAYSGDDEAVASLVVLQDTKRAYFALAGSHPTARKSDAVSLLWWTVMKDYGRTHSEIDLVGMDIPSIARFKRSFSPHISSYYSLDSYSSALSRVGLASMKKIKSAIKTRT